MLEISAFILYVLYFYVLVRVSGYWALVALFTAFLSFYFRKKRTKLTLLVPLHFVRYSLYLILLSPLSIFWPSFQLLGTALNALVIFGNSGMPVSTEWLSRKNIEEGYKFIGPDTKLVYLADIINTPGLGVLALGDIFIFIGEFFVIVKYFLN